MARKPRVQIIIDGKDNTKNAFGAIIQSLNALEQKAASVGRAMVGAFAGLVSIATLKRIADINMEFRELDRVLRQNTGSLEEFSFAQDETSRIADELGVSLDQVVNNFGKVNGSLATLGYSSRDSLKMVETISKLMALEGADPGPTIARFNRAMSKGELHGARFNLMLQDQPALLDLIAEATGKTIAELRAMSEAGELTADIMGDSLLQMSAAIDEQFAELPKTIDHAVTRIHGSIAESFRDEELMQPVVDSLNELADVLKDPDVRNGLASLASVLVGTTKTAAGAASEFGALGTQVGYWAASLTGNVSELDKLEAQIKDVDRALKGSFMSKPIQYLGTSEAELKAIRKQLENQREAIISEQTGTTLEMRQAEQQRQLMLKQEREEELKIHRKYVADLKTYNEQAVKAVEDRGKELAEAEKKSAKRVIDAKQEAENLLKEFDQIISRTKSGGEREPSYGEYQKLAAAARQALAAGDTKQAKEDALAAAEVLEQLAAAGANTFGFEGLQKQMKAIADEAGKLEQLNAQEELEAIQLEMAELAEQAAELKEMPVSMQADEESLESVKSQITALLEQLKVEAVIPVRMEAAGGTPDVAGTAPGFAEGGWTGPGSKYKFAGFVHADEHVQPKRIVREPGALQFLEYIRRNGFRNTINRIKGYAEGGLVGASYKAPNISQNLLEAPQQKNIGTLNFNLPGGESFSVNTVGDFSEDLRRAALKYGKPRR